MGLVRTLGDNVLGSPLVFDTFQWIVGAPRCHRYCIDEYVRVGAGQRVLDIGCGVGASLKHIPEGVEYVGFDISEDYIATARSRWGDRGKFICADASTFDVTSLGRFDRAFSIGVLHHVSDQTAHAMFTMASAATGPGGVFVTLDPCLVEGQNPIARHIIMQDRGRHVRVLDDYLKLARSHGDVQSEVATKLMNIPNTVLIMRTTFP